MHPGTLEEETVQLDALFSEDPLLPILPALDTWSSLHHQFDKNMNAEIQGQARLCHIQKSCLSYDHKCPVPKGSTYSRSSHHGVNQLKFAQSLRSAAEERAKPWGTLRVLHFTGLVKISQTSFLRLSSLIHSINYQKKSWNPVDHQTNPQTQRFVGTDVPAGLKICGFEKGPKFYHYWWSCSLEKALSNTIITANTRNIWKIHPQ